MNEEQAKVRTRMYEGFSPRIYLDSRGNLTGGWGSHLYENKMIPKTIWKKLFDYDFWQAERDYERLDLDLDECRKWIVVDLIYNMGLEKVRGFKKMLKFLRLGEYELAGKELLNSRYAKQVGMRAVMNANRLAIGEKQ